MKNVFISLRKASDLHMSPYVELAIELFLCSATFSVSCVSSEAAELRWHGSKIWT